MLSCLKQKVEELKQHYEVSLPSKDNPNHYNISAKDVPGALLNIALLNLGCVFYDLGCYFFCSQQ